MYKIFNGYLIKIFFKSELKLLKNKLQILILKIVKYSQMLSLNIIFDRMNCF